MSRPALGSPVAAPPDPAARPSASPLSVSRLSVSRLGAPAQVLLRAAAAAAAALTVAQLHSVHDPGVLCPLRRFTGIPCPLCGSTTVFIELGQGDWSAALAANPVTALAGLGLLAAPLGPGRWWWRASPRARAVLLAVALTAAWCWQVYRLGLPASPGA